MKYEWKTKTLGELTSYISKGIPPKYTNNYSNSTIIVLNQKCNRNFKISYEYARFHDLSQKKVPHEKILKNGDILINSTGTGTAGRIAQINNINQPVTIDGHMILMRPTKEVDNLYYGYALKSQQKQIELFAEGSTGQTEINKQRLINEILITYPSDIKIQHYISSILSALDDKIELNNKINENLEMQAQAIFKSWFVDFEPFGGVMPEDWEIKKVKDIPLLVTDYVANGSFASLKANVSLYQEKNYAYFIRNTDLKSGTFNVYVDEHSYKFLLKSVLYGGEIIISNVGDVGSVFLCPKLNLPMTLGNNIIMLRPENEIYQYFLYIWFKWMQGQAYIQSIKSGSAQPKFNKTDFKNTPMLIPNENILKKFHTLIKGIFKLIETNISENQRLAELRDTLLPKLMNGEIDVDDVQVKE